MTSPPPPPPLDALLPPGWPYPFECIRRDTGGPTLTYRCVVPWSPLSHAQRSEPLFDLLLALVRAGLGPATDWTLDPTSSPGQVTAEVAARSLALAARRRPVYGLWTDVEGTLAFDLPGEQWLTLEWPSTGPTADPPSSEPVAPVARLLAGASFSGLQVGALVEMLEHAVCDTCRHPLLATRIRHRQSLHTSPADESPDLGCLWPCGHQVLPDRPRCHCTPDAFIDSATRRVADD